MPKNGALPNQRTDTPAELKSGRSHRPWGGRACCSPRDAPTMGRARLLRPEGRANHGTGALIASRGTRQPWDGCAYHSPRDAPTMGGRTCCSPRGAPTTGRARLLQPERQAFPLTEGESAPCRTMDRHPRRTTGQAFPLTMGGCAYYSRGARRLWAGGLITARRDAPTMGRVGLSQPEGTRQPWGGRACCSPKSVRSRRLWAGALITARGADVLPTMGRAGLSQPEGRADHGRARLSQPEGRADHGAGALVAAAPRQNLQKLFSDRVLWQGVRGR